MSPANSPLFPVAIIAAFFVVFPLVWVSVVLLLSVVGGWGRLASRFRDTRPGTHGGETMVSGRLGLVSYRGVLMMAVEDGALRLGVLGLFRPGHPPLRIPLEAVRETPAASVFRKRVALDLGGVATLVVPEAVWRRVRGGSPSVVVHGP